MSSVRHSAHRRSIVVRAEDQSSVLREKRDYTLPRREGTLLSGVLQDLNAEMSPEYVLASL
jgi:hypothetical protein